MTIYYFEVKLDTGAYDIAQKIFTYTEDWEKSEVHDDLKNALGIEILNNLECNPYVLRLKQIPEGTRDQFKKHQIRDNFVAKKTSELNQKFLAVVKKHNLKYYDMFDLVKLFKNPFAIKALCPIKTNEGYRFFIELNNAITEDLQNFRNNPSLSEIPEYEYLELRAKMLKSKE